MTVIERQKLENLIANCKSELLNHTLQNEVVSPNIKKINSYLDECLVTLKSDWNEVSRMPRTRNPIKKGEIKDNTVFFAYCMSKWDFPFVNSLTNGIYTQSEAFEYLSQKLGVKVNTLRNYRDTFDSHVKQMRSRRQGWKKPLPPEFEEIKEKYDSFTEDELINIAKDILQYL